MSWLEEKQSAWLYRQAAQAEPDPRMHRLFDQLADAAEQQAAIWSGDSNATFKPDLRARVVAVLLQRIPPRKLRPILTAMKLRGLSAYDTPAHNLAGDGHIMPTSFSEVGRSHRGYGGGNLRAAVFGINDGLVSNTCLIMGVAGASVANQFIVPVALRDSWPVLCRWRPANTFPCGHNAKCMNTKLVWSVPSLRNIRRKKPRSWRSSIKRVVWNSLARANLPTN